MEKLQNEEQSTKKTWIDRLRMIGPGAVITASFIGPGTVTTATRAGASFGYALLWAVIFSIIATIVLQEMVARLGIITQEGLGEAIREQFSQPLVKFCIVWLVAIAITVGCAAYIGGDLLGTSLGITTITGLPDNIIAPIIGVIILFFGLSGSYKVIERLMVALIIVMGITFITTMFVVKPDFGEIFSGALIPTIPTGSIIMLIALIGTTVVPYNFFLQASTVQERWNQPHQLKDSRIDTIISISFGGLITAAILITSAAVIKGMTVESAADLSLQLEPVLGSWAKVFMSVGLFAAGLSSATASPLGAAITLASLFKWKGGFKDKRFKIVFFIIIVLGIIISATGFEPLDVLLFAQALNGILLPIISILILVVMNNKNRLGKYVNTVSMNIIGGMVVLVCTGLGIYSLIDAIQAFLG
ncbi:divalent metal cation transporter [Oceanobacillus piezotolerans]|uniref:Divalent metal cation transporter n=1 Tax=Oceanobacillus piezotolerans TaxID=2448030 RepID=A0A498DDF6_9BACI|nr:Nramp family divalent metal transporter [Oceanobacillus piezotolerans]RLL46997.1 divalent metal cation transporter [Oceanobacillus piezotolerans]